MAETLTFLPDFNYSMTYEVDVRVTKFEGYEQRTVMGMNPRRRIFNLQYNVLTGSEQEAIIAFYEPKLGVDMFNWTPPYYGAVAGKFIAEDLRLSHPHPDTYSVSVQVREVFEVG
jgi:phage-related protein